MSHSSTESTDSNPQLISRPMACMIDICLPIQSADENQPMIYVGCLQIGHVGMGHQRNKVTFQPTLNNTMRCRFCLLVGCLILTLSHRTCDGKDAG